MSLPVATKDTSEHPAKTAVAAPVNKEAKEADIDRKMRLYGVIQAFRLGRMPNNQQIDSTLKYVINNSPIDESKLSAEGKELTQDVRDLIETARLIVERKNADELFQNFMWTTRHVDTSTVKKDPNEVIPVDGSKVQQDRDQASKHLRTLLNLLATNEEARKLLSDFSILGRDILARGATHAADGIRPDQERLQKVDHAAPENQFVSAGGKRAGPDETPVAEASIPGVDGAVLHHPDGGVQVQKDGERYSVDEAKELTAQRARENAVRTREQATREAQQTKAETDQGELDPDQKKRGLKDRLTGFRDGMLDRVPDEHKDTTKGKFEDGKRVLSEEYFPEERRDQFIYRGKKVIVECQRHDDYQESIKWLLGLIEEYAGHGKHIASHGKDAHGQVTSDNAVQSSWEQLRTLLERFANNQSMNPIFNSVNDLIDDARNDQEFRDWWGRVDSYTRDVLLEPGFVLEPKCNDEGHQIRESGRRFYDDKYQAHFDRLFSTIGDWFKAMADDPLNKRFGDDLGRLTRDLLFDNEGGLKFKPELWTDIRKHILPTLVEQVGYVPIPRIEYTDDQLDLVIENLTFQGRNIFPNVVSMNANNFVKFSPYNTISDESHNEFTFTFGQVQADMRDVAFYFSKKTGFPKLTDQGLADVVLGGEGLTATVHVASSSKDKSSVFKVKDVNVKIDSLKFSIRDSKHDVLYKTLKPLATGLVKKQIQKAAEDAIRTGFEYVDGQLVTVRDRYTEAKKSDEASRADALKSVFQRNKAEAEQKKAEAQSTASQRNAQFKVSAQRGDAIVDAGHDAGYSIKAQERADAAKQGQGWHSDAFTIV